MSASEKLPRRAAVLPVDAEKLLVRIPQFPDDAPVGPRSEIQLRRREQPHRARARRLHGGYKIAAA
jgi:hypothetical protein